MIPRELSLIATIGAASILAGAARAQTAQVTMVHSDPNGIVMPGDTVTLRAVVSWQGAWQFAGLKGSAKATRSLGTSAAVNSALGPASPIVVFGTPFHGNVIGHDIAVVPGYFTTTPPLASLQSAGMDYLRYDWTAPTVGVPIRVDFVFLAEPIAPNVRLYPHTFTTAFVEAQTTYIGTSILVLPAPGVGCVVIAGFGLLAARRRR